MRRITLRIDGREYQEWTMATVERNMDDFSGSFSFDLRDSARAGDTFDYASAGDAYKLRPGPKVTVLVDGQVALVGYIEKVDPSIGPSDASVTISGRDVTGDMIDCAALTSGPSEFFNVKLEDAARRVAGPYGIGVRSEVDTGAPFSRYSLDIAETAFSAVEKGARQRNVLIMSDGIGNVVITRGGKGRAPGELRLPGNVISASGSFSHEGRHSETMVRGQSERIAKTRDDVAMELQTTPRNLDIRQSTDGTATERERKGTAAIGRAQDPEIDRYRPIVHLARSKADQQSAADEAEYRMRQARGESETFSYTVRGFGVGGRLWRVNELVSVDDNFLDLHRDMLVSRVTYTEDESGAALTELTVKSPEAMDGEATGGRRTNRQGKGKSKGRSGALDGTAEVL